MEKSDFSEMGTSKPDASAIKFSKHLLVQHVSVRNLCVKEMRHIYICNISMSKN